MERADGVDNQVPVPASGKSVWKKILLPVLCATIVTVFSLRLYNHRQLEHLAARKMLLKRALPSGQHPIAQQSHLPETFSVNNSRVQLNHESSRMRNRMLSKGSDTQSNSAGRIKVKRDVRLRWEDAGKTPHNPKQVPPSMNNGDFKRKIKTPAVGDIWIHQKQQLQGKNEQDKHISASDQHQGIPVRGSPMKGHQERHSISMNEKQYEPRVKPVNNIVRNSDLQANPLNNLSTRTPNERSKASRLYALRKGNDSYNGIIGKENSLSLNEPPSARSNFDIADAHLPETSNETLNESITNPARISQQKDYTRPGRTLLKRRLLSESELDQFPETENARQRVVEKISVRPSRLQQVWEHSLRETQEKYQKLSVISPKPIDPKELQSIGEIDLPESTGGNILSKTESELLSDDQHKSSSRSQTAGISEEQRLKYRGSLSIPTSVNLQKIWDKSITRTDSGNLNQDSAHVDTMIQKAYLTDKFSLQEIWANSILKDTQTKSSKVKSHDINDFRTTSGQAVPNNPNSPLLHNQIQTATSLKPALPNKSPPKRGNAGFPDVSLGTADLPPVVFRSKVMDFSSKPTPGKKYAVFSVAIKGTDYNYAFSVPLTVLAWQRIGYGTIVFLVGSEEYWVSNPILYYVLKELRRLDPIVLFLDGPKENWIFLSQVSRLFATNIFDWRGMESTPLVMSDTDIWPLTKEMYDLPIEKKVLSLNSDCCGSFKHKGKMYKMLPMCNIVMSVGTWREVIGVTSADTLPVTVPDMLQYFQEEFGELVNRPVEKGENDGWFLDQHMVSVRISQWSQRQAGDLVLYAPRNVGRDRVDRNHWFPYGITRRNDIHVLEHLYQPGTWERALPLFRQMYNETKNRNLEQYRDGFIRMMLNHKISN